MILQADVTHGRPLADEICHVAPIEDDSISLAYGMDFIEIPLAYGIGGDLRGRRKTEDCTCLVDWIAIWSSYVIYLDLVTIVHCNPGVVSGVRKPYKDT